MNNILLKRIELLANVSIIIVAVLLGSVLVKRFLFAPRLPDPNDGIKMGAKISVPQVDWAQSDRNLVLVLQKGCHFCAESAPFYQRLTRATARRNDVRLIAALPQDVQAGSQYLNDLGIAITVVRQATPASLGARGTPTLLLVDHTGAITAAWVGKLPPDKEAEVLGRLQAN